MGHYVTVIQNDPEVILHSLCTDRLAAKFAHLLDDVISYCIDIRRRICIAYHEMVGNGCPNGTEVNPYDILCFLVEHSVSHHSQIVCNHFDKVC